MKLGAAWAVLSLFAIITIPVYGQDQQPPHREAGQTAPGKAPRKPQAGQNPQKPPAEKPLPQVSPDARYDYQVEATAILQTHTRFHSPYEGLNSFRSHSETELSDTYTLFLGARLVKNLEVYINPELALGSGLSGGQGLAAYTNGDLIGQSSLHPWPYLARYFVRWRIPMPHLGHHAGEESEKEEETGRALNVIAGTIPTHRLLVTAGKFAVSDLFDVNSYANNPRTQFMNNAFGNNLAFDYPQETRGYDLGLAAAWINPGWAVRFGTFAMPTTAGGPDLAYNWTHSHGEVIEGEIHPQVLPGRLKKPPLVLRLTAFRNVANMGLYRDALAAQQPDMAPDISAVRRHGTVKTGIGLNFEQPLADGGNTGLFGRLGWSDGSRESYAFAECDRSFSLGGQLSGARWGRKDDRVGLAAAVSDLDQAHRDYLAMGGQGLALGDGALRYASERAYELYYSYQVSKPVAVSLDVQRIENPGFNHDRGPVTVWSIRIHGQF